MSNTKHAPGPWKLGALNDARFLAARRVQS
jgi:hypothetical protein